MMKSDERKKIIKRYAGVGISIMVLLITTTVAFSHGGKHGADELTHFLALKKAIELYDRLLEIEKLDQSWEQGLVKVDVSSRQKDGQNEIAVAFQRSEGEPSTVYIFFDAANGKYSGSNFTGK